ncbi:hypothetical protein [Caballeronia calidae]|nr:hypothetical protein [Caballeronia calidae]
MNLYANPVVIQRSQFRPTSFENRQKTGARQIPSYIGDTRFTAERDYGITSRRFTRDEANTSTVQRVRDVQRSSPTPTVEEVVTPTPVPNGERAVTERMANERMILLARQYAKGPNPQETELRLAIITQRILTLVPRVTRNHVDALELATREIAETEADLDERARRRAELRRIRNVGQGSERA